MGLSVSPEDQDDNLILICLKDSTSSFEKAREVKAIVGS